MDSQSGVCDALYRLAFTAQQVGDNTASRGFLERGVVIARDLARSAQPLDAAIGQRDFSTAFDHLGRSLRLNQEIAEPGAIAFVLVRFAHLATARGHAPSALRLAGAAAAL